jgi:Sec-independent protein translocase protein TatA
MDILGVGIPEVILIFLIMLIFAGPKRMAQWSFMLGRETAKLRREWAKARQIIRKELEAAGFTEEEIQELKNMPEMVKKTTRTALNPVSEISKQAGGEIKKAMEASALTAAGEELKEQTEAINAEAKKSEAFSSEAPQKPEEARQKPENGAQPPTEQ